MNYTQIKKLGKNMNQSKKPRFIIKKGKTFDVKERWVIFDIRYNEWVIAGDNYQELKVIAAEWNKEDVLERGIPDPSIILVHTKPYSWYELTMLKLNKTANTRIHRQNPAGLKLVG